ncbi:MAG: tellurium resistance protein TerC [Pseudomonadota bacterium]
MADAFTLESLFNLGVLLFLQAVLGFDNLLYISIESQRAPAADRARVRQQGIIIAIALRLVLLFVMIALIDALSEPFFVLDVAGIIEGGVNFSTIVFVFGGGFIMWTAIKEIRHLLQLDDPEHAHSEKGEKSATQVIALIVFMNLIFSFDSILSALAITDVFLVLAAAIVISGAGMYLLADTVSDFIAKNRKYEVLGLFILLIVGVVLLGEAGHAAEPHLHLFGYPVEPMSKTTFYFSVAVLVAVDIIQSGYQRKLAILREREQEAKAAVKAAVRTST